MSKTHTIGYAAEPGTGPSDKTCATCLHLWTQRYRTRKVFKCLLQVDHWTHGASSDIRKHSPACAKWVAETTTTQNSDAIKS